MAKAWRQMCNLPIRGEKPEAPARESTLKPEAPARESTLKPEAPAREPPRWRFGFQSWLLAALSVAVLLPAAASGRTIPYGDVKITPDPEQRGFSGQGYTEYGFTVVNGSDARRRVTLALGVEEKGRHFGDYIRSISRTVEVDPKAEVRVLLYQPAVPPLEGSAVTVTIDGKKWPERIGVQVAQNFGGVGGRHLILASRDFRTRLDRAGELDARWEIVGPERGSTPWPENWLGYSRYGGVIVTREALAALSRKKAARTALFQYVECGGSLLVIGRSKVDDGWKVEYRGDGYTRYSPSFGDCIVTDETMALWSPPLWNVVTNYWGGTPATTNFSPFEANSRLPVVDSLAIPARGLFVLMLGFAVVLGPVNIWLLTRWKRRIWMVWTVPAISAVTCAAVLGYMVVAEGWSGHLRTEAITVLDQNTERASTLGWTGFYTPLTPSDGLRFSQETELTLQIGTNFRDRFSRHDSNRACESDWSDGQRLTRGWVPARVPAHFKLRKSEATRLRVTVHRGPDGALSAVNGLGADIKKLTVADERGRLYVAGPVAAGARVSLQPTGRDLPPEAPKEQAPPGPPGGFAPPAAPTGLRSIYGDDWLRAAQSIRLSPEKYLAPLRYVADVDGGPFVEDGLPKAGSARRSAVVIGILKEIEQ